MLRSVRVCFWQCPKVSISPPLPIESTGPFQGIPLPKDRPQHIKLAVVHGPSESPGPLQSTGTILLVDDEELVLDVGRRMLARTDSESSRPLMDVKQ